MSDAGNVVRFSQVTKVHQRGASRVLALRDVTLDVLAGEFCAIVGPSGCGKSTLLNLIAGMDRPSSGEILFQGSSTATFSDKKWTHLRREVIGLVFQAFFLIPGLTAWENVALPLLLKGRTGRDVNMRVEECLEAVGLRHREHHRPGELSGGEQQRVAIARAMVHNPQLILADEPTGNLDSHSGEQVIALLRSLSHHAKQTVLMVTHSEAAIQQVDRVYYMKDGQVVGAATVET
jgi:ABC-type lipoprotein export system ATPase subunit